MSKMVSEVNVPPSFIKVFQCDIILDESSWAQALVPLLDQVLLSPMFWLGWCIKKQRYADRNVMRWKWCGGHPTLSAWFTLWGGGESNILRSSAVISFPLCSLSGSFVYVSRATLILWESCSSSATCSRRRAPLIIENGVLDRWFSSAVAIVSESGQGVNLTPGSLDKVESLWDPFIHPWPEKDRPVFIAVVQWAEPNFPPVYECYVLLLLQRYSAFTFVDRWCPVFTYISCFFLKEQVRQRESDLTIRYLFTGFLLFFLSILCHAVAMSAILVIRPSPLHLIKIVFCHSVEFDEMLCWWRRFTFSWASPDRFPFTSTCRAKLSGWSLAFSKCD